MTRGFTSGGMRLQAVLCLSAVVATTQLAVKARDAGLETCYWAARSAGREGIGGRNGVGFMEECREQCHSDTKCPHAEGDFCRCQPDLLAEPGEESHSHARLAVPAEFFARRLVSTDACLSKVTNKTGYIVAIIFSGRKRLMHVLVPYLERLVRQCSIHEVHMWDYTLDHRDSDWLKEVADNHSSWQLLQHRIVPGNYWNDLYAYYSSSGVDNMSTLKFEPRSRTATPQNTVLVKLDDDIVYVDTARFNDYTSYILNHREKFIVHANIVNNGVAAYYQAKHVPGLAEILPELTTYPGRNGHFGYYGWLLTNGSGPPSELHKYFLRHMKDFTWSDNQQGGCIAYGKEETARFHIKGQGRFSVNFMGTRWEEWDKVWQLVQTVRGGDENAVTTGATEQGLEECMYTGFVVSHFSFHAQKLPWDILDGYETLLSSERKRWA